MFFVYKKLSFKFKRTHSFEWQVTCTPNIASLDKNPNHPIETWFLNPATFLLGVKLLIYQNLSLIYFYLYCLDRRQNTEKCLYAFHFNQFIPSGKFEFL